MALALQHGTRIGGFELSDVIGRGGFGITYRAREDATGRIYAIKEYLPEAFARRDPSGTVSARAGQDETYAHGLRAFTAEANILKDLPRREGLVRVRGAFAKFGTAYCVMEFIEGDSLERMARRMTTRAGGVPEDLVTDLAISVAWALDALHRAGVIHRDVKPANIMIRRTGRPVLIDFGAARRLRRRVEEHTIFTRRYAAVEQFPLEMTGLGHGFEEGPWTDIYALGVVLHELVAGAPPPDVPTRSTEILAGRPDPYRPLARTGRGGPASAPLLSAIDAACSLMPRNRPAHARALAEAIRPGAWQALTRMPDPAARAPRAPGRGSRATVLVGAMLAVLAAAMLFLRMRAADGTV